MEAVGGGGAACVCVQMSQLVNCVHECLSLCACVYERMQHFMYLSVVASDCVYGCVHSSVCVICKSGCMGGLAVTFTKVHQHTEEL